MCKPVKGHNFEGRMFTAVSFYDDAIYIVCCLYDSCVDSM